jgi:hypothetical protein
MKSIKVMGFPKRPRRIAGKRHSGLSILVIALLAGGTAFSVVMFGPRLWAAATGAFRQTPLTYQQCEAVQEDTRRLACYDRLLRHD